MKCFNSLPDSYTTLYKPHIVSFAAHMHSTTIQDFFDVLHVF